MTGRAGRIPWSRLGELERWKVFLDLALKAAAIFALAASGYHFLLTTNVVAGASSQRLVDRALLVQRYQEAGDEPPAAVLEVVDTYNKTNLRDLAKGANSSLGLVTQQELCEDPVEAATKEQRADHREDVEDIVGSSYCERPGDPVEERGPYYARLLAEAALTGSEPELTKGQAKRAIDEIEGSVFRRYRVCVRNVGDYRATDVRVTGAAGYRPLVAGSEAGVTLDGNDETIIDFESEHGFLNALPPALNSISATTTTLPSGTPTTTPTTAADPSATTTTGTVELLAPDGTVEFEVPDTSCLAGTGVEIGSDFTVSHRTRAVVAPELIAIAAVLVVAGFLALMLFAKMPDDEERS